MKLESVGTVPLGEYVFAKFNPDNTPASLVVRDVPRMRALIGDDLLTFFVRGFNAAERFDALGHLIVLNSPLSHESIAYRRNLTSLSFMQFGTLHEAMNAFEDLDESKLIALVGASNAAWLRLKAMRDHWAAEPLLGRLRNKLSFHLGDRAVIRAGLDAFVRDREVEIFATDTRGSRAGTAYPIALEVVFAGLAIDDTVFWPIVEKMAEHHVLLGLDLQELFCDALRACGVAIEPRK